MVLFGSSGWGLQAERTSTVGFLCMVLNLGIWWRGWDSGAASLVPSSPVVPFYPFSFWVPLLKPKSRKKGTLIIKGLLGNLEERGSRR